MNELARAFAVDNNGGLCVGALLRFSNSAELSVIQDFGIAVAYLPRRSVRHAEGILSCCFKRSNANLNERFYLPAIACRIAQIDFRRTSGKKSGLFPVRFEHFPQLPADETSSSSCR
jgi:hypothetical protein